MTSDYGIEATKCENNKSQRLPFQQNINIKGCMLTAF